MSKYQDRAMELRHDPTFHYNCAQAVLMPFSEKLGLTEAQAQDLGSLLPGGCTAAPPAAPSPGR